MINGAIVTRVAGEFFRDLSRVAQLYARAAEERLKVRANRRTGEHGKDGWIIP